MLVAREIAMGSNEHVNLETAAQMNTNNLDKHFQNIGTRVKIGVLRSRPFGWGLRQPRRFTIDVQKDKRGEFFEILARPNVKLDFVVLDSQPKDHHLLLLIKRYRKFDSVVERFLCGHDERAWFVAVAPSGSSVNAAKESLKPRLVTEMQDQVQVKPKDRQKRKTPAFLRQGEWFFIPRPDLQPDEQLVLRNEPLRRPEGKPHVVQFLYRRGGTTVHVCHEYPSGLTHAEYQRLIHHHPEKRNLPWFMMKRDPEAFAKGTVKHSDHKTIFLPFWHRVAMNTESQAKGAHNVAFLDRAC
jgi:hypothetical protein